MLQDKVHILLIEQDDHAADRTKELLRQALPSEVALTRVTTLKEGTTQLRGDYFDIALVDNSLPDSQGLDPVERLRDEFPSVPLIILTALNDVGLAIRSVQMGAQDYLVKSEIDERLLGRAVVYAIERSRLLNRIKELSLQDELTHLYNRRGFYTLAEQQIRLAKRERREALLFYADLDGLKKINDKYGHIEGDQAIRQVAVVLKETFRDSDILGRIGGDEFVVLTTNYTRFAERGIFLRLYQNLEKANRAFSKPYQVSFSAGYTVFDPKDPCDIDKLIREADRSMYLSKSGVVRLNA